jgi:uncharacterized membrane protein YecN with MAPEG domain
VSTGDRSSQHEHFGKATYLIAAAFVALAALFTALIASSGSIIIAGLILGAGAVMVGLLVRRVAGNKAMWTCFGLAALAVVVAILLELSLSSFS